MRSWPAGPQNFRMQRSECADGDTHSPAPCSPDDVINVRGRRTGQRRPEGSHARDSDRVQPDSTRRARQAGRLHRGHSSLHLLGDGDFGGRHTLNVNIVICRRSAGEARSLFGPTVPSNDAHDGRGGRGRQQRGRALRRRDQSLARGKCRCRGCNPTDGWRAAGGGGERGVLLKAAGRAHAATSTRPSSTQSTLSTMPACPAATVLCTVRSWGPTPAGPSGPTPDWQRRAWRARKQARLPCRVTRSIPSSHPLSVLPCAAEGGWS